MRWVNRFTAQIYSSFSTHRSFQFDELPSFKPTSPHIEKELDEVAMSSIKQLKLPSQIIEKLEKLFRAYGSKQDIEKIGLYISRKLHSRSSVELPRVLHSSLLPLSSSNNSIAKSLLKSIGSNSKIHQNELPVDSKIYLDALTRAEDDRHKLFKMSYFPEAALAFMGQRLAGMYASHYRILYEIKKRAPLFIPRKIMDYNANIAPATLASNTIWQSELIDVLAIEASENLSQIGQFLCQDLPFVRWQYNYYEDPQVFDLIICNYSMSEMNNMESREVLIRNLWNKISTNGMLVIVEPGTPTGFRNIFTIRELFISELTTNQFHFLAPCPHENVCPMALTGKDWCHFSQRISQIPKHVYRKSRKHTPVNYEDEKFSYLVIVKSKGPRSIFKKEENSPNTVTRSYFWPRIVLPVIKGGKHVLIDVCSSPHSFERLTVTKASPKAAGYRFARNALWGDLWHFPKRIIRPEARDYGPDDVKKHYRRFKEREIKPKKPNTEGEESKELAHKIESTMIQNYGA